MSGYDHSYILKLFKGAINVSEYFPLNLRSFPYEFIHAESDDIIVEVEFDNEPAMQKSLFSNSTGFTTLKGILQTFYYRYIKLRLIPYKECSHLAEAAMHFFDMGKVIRVKLYNENITWKAIENLIWSLSGSYNYHDQSQSKVNSIKIIGDLSKIDLQGQPTAGRANLFKLDFSYTRTNEEVTKFVVTAEKDFDRDDKPSLKNSLANWHFAYVEMSRSIAETEKKIKIRVKGNVCTATISGEGINTNNLFYLLFKGVYLYKENKVTRVDIYSNDKPTLEHMMYKMKRLDEVSVSTSKSESD